MLIHYSISESWNESQSVMTSGTREIQFLFSLYFLNGKKGKCINRLAPDVRASSLITSLWLCYSRSRCVFVPHPSPQFTSPTLFSSTAFRSDTATIRYSDRREIDMSPWIYGDITGDFETPHSLTVSEKRKKRIPQSRQKRQKSWRKHKHK